MIIIVYSSYYLQFLKSGATALARTSPIEDNVNFGTKRRVATADGAGSEKSKSSSRSRRSWLATLLLSFGNSGNKRAKKELQIDDDGNTIVAPPVSHEPSANDGELTNNGIFVVRITLKVTLF